MRYKLIEKNGLLIVSKLNDDEVVMEEIQNEPEFNEIKFSSYASKRSIKSKEIEDGSNINVEIEDDSNINVEIEDDSNVNVEIKDEKEICSMVEDKSTNKNMIQKTLIASSVMLGLASFSHALSITEGVILSNMLRYNPVTNALFNSEFKLMDRLYWILVIIAFGYTVFLLIKRDFPNIDMNVFDEFFILNLIIVPLLFIFGTTHVSRHTLYFLSEISPYTQWLCLGLSLILLWRAMRLFRQNVSKTDS